MALGNQAGTSLSYSFLAVDSSVPSWQVTTESPIFAALMAGLYVSVFYIMMNVTMLPASSMLIVAIVLILPITMAVALLLPLLNRLRMSAYAKPISVFVCAVYLLALMQRPVFEIAAFSDFIDQYGSATRVAVKLIYLIVPATLFAYVFRDSIGKLAIILGTMTLASLVGKIHLVAGNTVDQDNRFGSEMAKSLRDISLSRSPNIYFILADGYSSFAYMEEHDIDVRDFRSFLSNSGFHLYDEAFSNYHSTAESLPAILNMDHHYYTLNYNRKTSEVRKTGRIITGGNNNLVDLLRNNSYSVQYIHNWPYLLLHGCTADHCYGEIPFAGAKMVLGGLLPFAGAQTALDEIWSRLTINEDREEQEKGDLWLRRSKDLKRYGKRRSLDDSRHEIVRLIEENPKNSPIFQYIHLYAPIHAPDSQVGICDEKEQVAYYSERIAEVNLHLQNLVSEITSRDSNAVIVLTSDHGPYIASQCSRWTDLDTLSGYRDRMGVIMAIRWPEGYDGRYNERIITTVNLFRYVLAALTEDDADILQTVVCDDVYILGSKDILKIIEDGNIRIPPEHLSINSLRAKQDQACQKSAY